jgi:hypothetical protein
VARLFLIELILSVFELSQLGATAQKKDPTFLIFLGLHEACQSRTPLPNSLDSNKFVNRRLNERDRILCYLRLGKIKNRVMQKLKEG